MSYVQTPTEFIAVDSSAKEHPSGPHHNAAYFNEELDLYSCKVNCAGPRWDLRNLFQNSQHK